MELLQALQEIGNPVLDVVFEAFTLLGEHVVLAGLVCLLYWCVDKELGACLLVSLCFGTCVNGLIKDLVKAPRPFSHPGIEAKRVETATGHSFPSGHSQGTATVWTGIALWFKKPAAWLISAAIMLGVGFSRLYLGVHFLQDVLGGLAVGCLVALVTRQVLTRLTLNIAMVMSAAAALLCLIFGESADTFSAVGLAVGMIPGLALERRYVNFTVPRSPKAAALRLLCGMAVVGAAYLIPKLLIALLGLPASNLYYMVRGALIAFFGAGGYPWLFGRWEKRKPVTTL